MVSCSISFRNVRSRWHQIPQSRLLRSAFTYKWGQSTFTRNNLRHYFINGADFKKHLGSVPCLTCPRGLRKTRYVFPKKKVRIDTRTRLTSFESHSSVKADTRALCFRHILSRWQLDDDKENVLQANPVLHVRRASSTKLSEEIRAQARGGMCEVVRGRTTRWRDMRTSG